MKRCLSKTLLLGVMVAVLPAGCKRPSGGDRGAPTGTQNNAGKPVVFPVEVMPVSVRQLDYQLSAPGTIAAFETVQVTARVAGVVDRVRFKEGDRVKAGQSLVEIEPERYELVVAATRAALEKTRASVADAEAGVARREAAVASSPGLIPGEEVATWKTRVRTAMAEVAAAQSALAQAELNLRDAYLRAPVAGIIETRTVQTGQYVQPGVVLATLVRRDPLLLRFTLAAGDADSVKRGMTARFRVPGTDEGFAARITHVAAAADQASRMVMVTSEIEKPDHPGLKPGAFAEVTVPLENRGKVPAIPETAVRPSEQGFVAFVAEGNRAVKRVLQLGLRTSDGLVEVKSGLAPGDRVIVRGAEALSDGVEVRVESDGKPPA